MVHHILSSYPSVPVKRLEITCNGLASNPGEAGEEGARRNSPMENSQNYCTQTGPPKDRRDGGPN